MKLTTFVAALAGGCLATSAMAQSDALAQIAELRAQLAAVQAQASNNTLTEERAAEIKAIVRDTLADADTRASLQGGGAQVGYDNGFFMSSADGNFKLRLGLLAQARFVWEFDTDETMGFENRRTQLAFGGNMFNPSWTYNVVINYAPYTTPYGENGSFQLADASVTKSMDGGWGITAGQFRTPFTRATLVGDGKQLMADYSPTDYNFSAGYEQGIMGFWSNDMLKAQVSLGNGLGNLNGTWSNATTNAEQFNLAVRAEWKVAGSWAQFNKETSFRGEEFGLLIGAGWIDTDGNGNPAGNYGDTGNNNALTLDATAFFGGANVSAAYTYANSDTNAGDDAYGLSVQGGVFVTDEVEAWGGWNYIDGKNGSGGAGADEAGNWIQVGVNWYFAKNGCKWTTQLNIPLNDATNPAYSYGGAWGWDSPTGDTSVLTQLQFMF